MMSKGFSRIASVIIMGIMLHLASLPVQAEGPTRKKSQVYRTQTLSERSQQLASPTIAHSSARLIAGKTHRRIWRYRHWLYQPININRRLEQFPAAAGQAYRNHSQRTARNTGISPILRKLSR